MNVNDDTDEKGASRIVKVDNNVVLQVLSVANGGASENEIKSKIKGFESDTNLLKGYLEHLMESGLIGYMMMIEERNLGSMSRPMRASGS